MYEGDWVKVYDKPYQIERLVHEYNEKEEYILSDLVLNGLRYAVPIENVQEYLPSYEILFHRYNYYKELLLRTEEFLDGLDLYNTNLFNDISKVLEEWE